MPCSCSLKRSFEEEASFFSAETFLAYLPGETPLILVKTLTK